jgi:hypothetical protein
LHPLTFRVARVRCSLEFGKLGWWGNKFAFGCDRDELVHEVKPRDPHVVKPAIWMHNDREDTVAVRAYL